MTFRKAAIRDRPLRVNKHLLQPQRTPGQRARTKDVLNRPELNPRDVLQFSSDAGARDLRAR